MRRKCFVLLLILVLELGASMSVAQNHSSKKPQTATRTFSAITGDVRLMTLAPGHFHASLVQKVMYGSVSPVVYVYAPPGSDLDEHLQRVAAYNTRSENPTRWEEKLYSGSDFFERMLAERSGNVVVIAGNNRKKTDYLSESINAGLNVLADKPMCIDRAGFEKLKAAFATAEKKHVLLYDIMTERYEITTILQKALVNDASVFGRLQKGTLDHPAVTKESVHYLFKYVSGKPLRRPAWFFDVSQQGEGIVDITTHLVDLIQWESFPEQSISPGDIRVLRARRWPTVVTREQFEKVTGLNDFPGFLRGALNRDGALPDFSNGELSYQLKGVHAKVSVTWNFEAPQGAGDTHFSVMRGTKANVVIRQGKEQNYRPELYVEAAAVTDRAALQKALQRSVTKLQTTYPGLELKPEGDAWRIVIPDKYRADHEAHFGQVMEKFLAFLRNGELPAWEIPNMIAKYYTTITALEMAHAARLP